jgi:hypothetical protein
MFTIHLYTRNMKSTARYFLLIISLSLTKVNLHAQTVFSEKQLDYKKALIPYDVPYTFALPGKEFIMLQERKKNVMVLGRYDQYLFEKWEKEIEFSKEQHVPEIFVRRDTVITYSCTVLKDKKQIQLTFRYFSVTDGTEFQPTSYVLEGEFSESINPILAFSDDRSKFVIYNYPISVNGETKTGFQIFKIGIEKPLSQFQQDPSVFASPKAHKVYLNNNGDILLAAVDPVEFRAETYFRQFESTELIKSESNFFFERPPDKIGEIEILRQGASSYFITFSGIIENELIGFSVLGINVVLKTVMFSYNQNISQEEIASAYENFILTSEKQKKKYLVIPESLEDFRLVQTFENEDKDVIVVFEELEIPSGFHERVTDFDMPWKFKTKEDKFYYGGDIIMYCFTEAGIRKWKKAIQKSQFSQANSLGLSYIPYLQSNELSLLCSESSKDGNFYVLRINTTDGSLVEKVNLLPDENLECTKKYSCWLNADAVIVCGISATNSAKRNLMLVEF